MTTTSVDKYGTVTLNILPVVNRTTTQFETADRQEGPGARLQQRLRSFQEAELKHDLLFHLEKPPTAVPGRHVGDHEHPSSRVDSQVVAEAVHISTNTLHPALRGVDGRGGGKRSRRRPQGREVRPRHKHQADQRRDVSIAHVVSIPTTDRLTTAATKPSRRPPVRNSAGNTRLLILQTKFSSQLAKHIRYSRCYSNNYLLLSNWRLLKTLAKTPTNRRP
ncbi:hypothetical protein K469DRAFT_691941 [Zopfia rhizophila CBS 207.26]|uniref:Uncharacterized protein n=1 Tax=Zopfia rhizophila CBS 207.26 TaxID=1314779 RepID=A0A6A6DUI0_9PEZI|nr:hypothetical protein K469DRAFT_691941 [Zopfia rhizophila CBS 207.26]